MQICWPIEVFYRNKLIHRYNPNQTSAVATLSIVTHVLVMEQHKKDTTRSVTYTGSERLSGMLDTEDMCVSLARWTSNVALRAGSSKHGKAFLASVGWNCVTANTLTSSGMLGFGRIS